jgi:hypothetical protein
MPRKKSSGPQPERLVRLTFEYRDGEVQLVARQSVEMTLPAEPVPAKRGGGPEPGLGVQLRDAADRPVYHRTVREGPRPDAEVFMPGGEVRREEVPRPEGAFTVLVPEVPDAAQVVLMDQPPPPKPGMRAGPPAEIARFSLADVPDDDDDGEARP